MLRQVRNGLLFGFGFWLAPLLLAMVLTGVGLAAGVASAPERSASIPTASAAPVAEGTAPRQFAAQGTIARIGRPMPEGRLLVVHDPQNRAYRVLMTADTIIKKNGKRVKPAALAVDDLIVGVGERLPNGVFLARAINVVGQPVTPAE